MGQLEFSFPIDLQIDIESLMQKLSLSASDTIKTIIDASLDHIEPITGLFERKGHICEAITEGSDKERGILDVYELYHFIFPFCFSLECPLLFSKERLSKKYNTIKFGNDYDNLFILNIREWRGAVDMKLDYGLDRFYLPTKIHIIPSKDEDPDFLHNCSMRLLVENPSLDFANAAKAGVFDKYSDEEYEKMLAVVKRINLLFYSEKGNKPLPAINIFDLTIRLLYEYMFNQHSEVSRIL